MFSVLGQNIITRIPELSEKDIPLTSVEKYYCLSQFVLSIALLRESGLGIEKLHGIKVSRKHFEYTYLLGHWEYKCVSPVTLRIYADLNETGENKIPKIEKRSKFSSLKEDLVSLISEYSTIDKYFVHSLFTQRRLSHTQSQIRNCIRESPRETSIYIPYQSITRESEIEQCILSVKDDKLLLQYALMYANQIPYNLLKQYTNDNKKLLRIISRYAYNDIFDGKERPILQSNVTMYMDREIQEYKRIRNLDIDGLRKLHNSLKDDLLKAYLTENLNILDCGCGRGGDFPKFERLGVVVSGVDPDPKAIEKARFRAGGLRHLKLKQLYVGDIFDVDGYFDAIIYNFSLQYIVNSDIKKTAAKIAFHIPENGILFGIVPDRELINGFNEMNGGEDTLGNKIRAIDEKTSAVEFASGPYYKEGEIVEPMVWKGLLEDAFSEWFDLERWEPMMKKRIGLISDTYSIFVFRRKSRTYAADVVEWVTNTTVLEDYGIKCNSNVSSTDFFYPIAFSPSARAFVNDSVEKMLYVFESKYGNNVEKIKMRHSNIPYLEKMHQFQPFYLMVYFIQTILDNVYSNKTTKYYTREYKPEYMTLQDVMRAIDIASSDDFYWVSQKDLVPSPKISKPLVAPVIEEDLIDLDDDRIDLLEPKDTKPTVEEDLIDLDEPISLVPSPKISKPLPQIVKDTKPTIEEDLINFDDDGIDLFDSDEPISLVPSSEINKPVVPPVIEPVVAQLNTKNVSITALSKASDYDLETLAAIGTLPYVYTRLGDGRPLTYKTFVELRDMDIADDMKSNPIKKYDKTFVISGDSGLDKSELIKCLTEDFGLRQVELGPNVGKPTVVWAEPENNRYVRDVFSVNCYIKNILNDAKDSIRLKDNLYENMKTMFPDVAKVHMARTLKCEPSIRVDRDDIFIVKPVSGYGGKGISIVTGNDGIEKARAYAQKQMGPKCNIIMSEYIKNPLLWNNKKFHIRMYLLVVANKIQCELHGSVWGEGKMFTALKDFELGNFQDMDIHDTHAKSTKGDLYFIEDFSKGTLSSYTRGVIEDPSEVEKLQRNIMGQITVISQSIIRILWEKIGPHAESENAFEIFGMDYMVRDDGTVVLIEVNDKVGYAFNDQNQRSKEFSKGFFYWVCNRALASVIPLGRHLGKYKYHSYSLTSTKLRNCTETHVNRILLDGYDHRVVRYNNKPVGMVSIRPLEINKQFVGPQLRYFIDPEFSGKGIMTIALNIYLYFLTDNLSIKYINKDTMVYAVVHPDNQASISLLQKLNFTKTKLEKRYKGIPHFVFSNVLVKKLL